MQIKLKIQRLRAGVQIPTYQTARAAGIDLSADLEHELILAPMERVAVPTGLKLEIPDGFEGQVRPRSGRAIDEGLALINSPGTIDADYRGELKVLLVNLGSSLISIRPGERIAQLVITPVARAEIVEVAQVATSTRGGGGFGHTGR